MSFAHDIVVSPPCERGVGVGMPGASQSIAGAFLVWFLVVFFFSQALIQSVSRGRGVTQPQSPLHTIGQGTKTSLTRGVKW